MAKQQRQGALSIGNVKDRRSAAEVNYAMVGRHSQITAKNDINRQRNSPFTYFANIVASGMGGYGTMGKFGSPTPTKSSAQLHR
ncbi:MAG TPA: hypothetical protein DIC56_09870 [Rhizobium sp.]|nr:hypothetical protein [Rhizobium sp.]